MECKRPKLDQPNVKGKDLTPLIPEGYAEKSISSLPRQEYLEFFEDFFTLTKYHTKKTMDFYPFEFITICEGSFFS